MVVMLSVKNTKCSIRIVFAKTFQVIVPAAPCLASNAASVMTGPW